MFRWQEENEELEKEQEIKKENRIKNFKFFPGLGMVAVACNPNYSGSRARRIRV
jgi:hypothetical protein